MTVLTKRFEVEVVPGVVGTPGTPGVVARPGYWAEETILVEAVTEIAQASVQGSSDYVPYNIIEAGGTIRFAIYEEVCLIPKLKALADDFLAGKDPGEVIFSEQIVAYIQEARSNDTLGQPLYVVNNLEYLAVWFDSRYGGYGIFYFSGFTSSERPTMHEI